MSLLGKKKNKTVKKKTPEKRASTCKTSKTMKRDDLVKVKIKNHRDKNGGHPHVILESFEDKHVSVGLSTHEKKGKNHPNYRCEVDPLGQGKTSYLRRQGTVDKIENYHGQFSGNMASKDYAKAKQYGDAAKVKYIKEHEKKQ